MEIVGPLNERQKQYLSNLKASGRHLLGLISDVLNLSKIEEGREELELDSCHLEAISREAVAGVREGAGRVGIALHLYCHLPALFAVPADSRKIRQILFNLLSNAIKFTPANGSVSLTLRQVSFGELMEITPLLARELQVLNPQDASYVEFCVSDTGIGISVKDLGKLFKPFSQVDTSNARAYEGSGLGLFITKKLVELHGGRIWVQTVLGQGSKFFFVLPAGEYGQ
ncbi:MAG TPA: ATP-binding protein, partial [Elusimicrobiales bacterium]|nr:ATP-binding protein [Elusimicrobiales bacterium]